MTTTAQESLLDEYGDAVEELLADGPIRWHEEREAWVVTGYAECAAILRDDELFTKADRFRPGGPEFWRGRDLPILAGADHRRLHSSRLRQIGREYADSIRESITRPIARELARQLVEHGSGDLSREYSDRLALLVGCSYMGFDVTADDFLRRVVELELPRDTWKQYLLSGRGEFAPAEVRDDGEAAVDALRDLFLPTIRARQVDPTDDLISRLWREGPRVFADWGADDMVAACWSHYGGGETRLLIRNLLYLLLQDGPASATARRTPEVVPAFVEEGLRYLGPFWCLPARLVTRDTEIAGTAMHSGDSVLMMVAAANRDPARWPEPRTMRLDRVDAGDHLTFGQGPRYCIGRYLGRAETIEAVAAIADLADRLTLNPDADPPRWHGEYTRSVAPLHVLIS